MKLIYEDFIGIYDDVLPDGACSHLITEFDRLELERVGSNRQQSEDALRHVKDDYQVFVNMRHFNILPFKEENSVDMFFNGLQQCYDKYSEQYSVLRLEKISGNTMKMQRTSPGGGYHVWHSEQGSGNHASRVLAYMLYLNTLPENCAGETEFLYQRKRYRPIENRLIIWPAAFTHAHRGNTVFGDQSKYIITGWFYYD
jgi:hypothetical protein